MRQGIKRLLLMLAGFLLLGSGALAQPQWMMNEKDAYGGLQREIYTMASDGETLWLLSGRYGEGDALYAYRPGMEAPEQQMPVVLGDRYTQPEEAGQARQEAGAAWVFGTLYGGERTVSIDPVTGRILQLSWQDGRAAVEELAVVQQMDALRYANSASMKNVLSACTVADTLYLVIQDWDAEGRLDCALYAVGLLDGAVTRSGLTSVCRVMPYEPGRLLVARGGGYNAQDVLEPITLGVWDPATDSVTGAWTLMEDSSAPMCWDAAGKRIIYLKEGRVMGWSSTGEHRQLAYLPMGYVTQLAMLGETLAVSDFSNGLALCRLQEDYSPEVSLNVYGGWIDDGVELMIERMPDAAVYPIASYYDGVNGLCRAMAGDTPEVDVAFLELAESSLSQLAEQGVCADLSGYPALTEAVAGMLPALQEAVTRDGKLIAVPVDAYGFGYTANLAVMERLGLTEAALPRDYVSLCAFITRWNDQWVEDYPDLMPMYLSGDLRGDLLRAMVQDYLGYCQASGEALSFDTPLFREMLDALAAMRCDALDQIPQKEGEEGVWSREMLLENGMQVVGNFYGYVPPDRERAIFMKLTPTAACAIPLRVRIMVLSAGSSQLDAGAGLIACELETRSSEARYTLDAETVAPAERADYAQRLEQLEKELKVTRSACEHAEGEQRAQLEEMAAYQEAQLAYARVYQRYEVMPEALSYYRREIAPYVYVQQPLLTDSTEAALDTTLSRYLTRLISREQLIREMDQLMQPAGGVT